ncbi:MAG TPA: hypothetical protein VLR89_02300 [Anaerolineaceae bacterium]|nr:hypothetical protein [Anaerolineaceae bacterium]
MTFLFRLLAFGCLILSLLAGCTQSQPQATNSIEPAIIEKTSPGLHFVNFQGGYEFYVPTDTIVRVTAGQSLINYQSPQVRLNVIGTRSMTSAYQPAEIMAMVLASLFESNTPLEVSNQQELTVAGHPAIQQDFTGGSGETAITGKVVVFKPSPTGFLLILGSAPLVDGKPTFADKAQTLYEAFLDNVIVLPQADLKDAEVCPVANKSTYGTASDNPIKIGGGQLLGQARELAYLDNLLDQEGKLFSYNRLGPLNASGNDLDQVQLTLADKDLTLYFDLENYEPLFAPIGMQCMGKFPLVEP